MFDQRKMAHGGDNPVPVQALFTKAVDALGIGAFRQPLAVFIADQRVMRPYGFRAVHQHLQDSVKRGLRP